MCEQSNPSENIHPLPVPFAESISATPSPHLSPSGHKTTTDTPTAQASVPALPHEPLEPSAGRGLGSSAARQAYVALEIFEQILRHVDRHTLAGMLRLEKRATASVAKYLYPTVHIDQVAGMTRKDPRRVIYCDAVTSIDLSPHPKVSVPHKEQVEVSDLPPPILLDPLQLLSDIATYRSKFPHLRTILYEDPVNDLDDAYVVHLDGEAIGVDLESRVVFDISTHPYPDNVHPERSFPPARTADGLDIRHTLLLKVISTADYYGRDYRDEAEEEDARLEMEDLLEAWAAHLYSMVCSYEQVSGLDINTVPPIAHECAMWEEACRGRHRAEISPLRTFSFSNTYRGATAQELQALVTALGPEIRNLRVPASINGKIKDWHVVLSMFDAAFPLLRNLIIADEWEDRPPLGPSTLFSGIMPNLRTFTLADVKPVDLFGMAHCFSGMGCPECVFYPDYFKVDLLEEFNGLVRKLKSVRPEHSLLHSTLFSDLDINSVEDYAVIAAQGTSRPLRRVARSKIAIFSSDLASAQEQFSTMVGDHRTAAGKIQELLGRTADGLDGALGDTLKENAVLKKEFLSLPREANALRAKCEEMRKALVETEKLATTISGYGSFWLAKQGEKERDQSPESASQNVLADQQVTASQLGGSRHLHQSL